MSVIFRSPCAICLHAITEQEATFCPECGEKYHSHCWKAAGYQCKRKRCLGSTKKRWLGLESFSYNVFGFYKKGVLIQCPQCNSVNSPYYRYCPRCGCDINHPQITRKLIGYSPIKFLIWNKNYLFVSLLSIFIPGFILISSLGIKGGISIIDNLPTRTPTNTITLTPIPISITQISSITSSVTPSPTFTPQPTKIPSATKPNFTNTPKPQPTPTINNAQVQTGGDLIAFQTDKNGNFDIYVINWKTKELTQLTTSKADETVPSWSPNGNQIAFQSFLDTNWEIYTVKLENKKLNRITNNHCADWAPSWSPDATQFAFYSDCDGNREIYVINSDGSERKQLTFTNGENIYNWFPTWSPDGKKIVFASNREGGKYNIYVMNADGTNQTKLALGCIPTFTPDGKKILFAQYCTDSGNLLIMDTNGQNVVTLMRGNYRNPTFSPDGTKIVFQNGDNERFDLWIADADGSNPVRLTDFASNTGAPAWQP